MYCINCGARLIDGAKFCHMCGQKSVNAQSTVADTVNTIKKPEDPRGSSPRINDYRLPPSSLNGSEVASEMLASYEAETYDFTLEEFDDNWPEYYRANGRMIRVSAELRTDFYMATLLCTFFADYEIYADIPYATVFPKLSAMHKKDGDNVTFLLCRNNKPAVAIQLCDPQHYKFGPSAYTMKAFADCGVPALRFFRGWSNEVSYCVDRIKACLKSRH